MKIKKAGDVFRTQTAQDFHRWLLNVTSTQMAMAALSITDADVGSPDDVDASAPPAIAYVNYARWVADCPLSGCGGAVILQPAVPFMCPECLNIEIGHRYRHVLWPDNLQEIEGALAPRLLPQQANWLPAQTVDELTAENIENGAVLP